MAIKIISEQRTVQTTQCCYM